MSFFGSQWATRMEEARIAAYVKASAERTAKWRRENQDKILAFNKKWGLGEFAKPKELAPLPAKVGDSGRCGSKIGLPPTPEQLVVGKSNLRSVQRYCPTVDELWIGSFSLKKTKRPLQPCDPALLGPLPIPIEPLETKEQLQQELYTIVSPHFRARFDTPPPYTNEELRRLDEITVAVKTIDRESAAIAIQSTWRGSYCRQWYSPLWSVIRGEACWPEYQLPGFAIQIQRVWRGFHCRRVLALRRVYEETGKLFGRFDGLCKGYNGATAIQSTWRGFNCRREYAFLVDKLQWLKDVRQHHKISQQMMPYENYTLSHFERLNVRRIIDLKRQ